MNFICLLSATRSGATKRVRGMLLMSGKQFSLDSRIDLAEAVEEEEQHQDITEVPEEEKGCHSTHSVSVAYIAHNSHITLSYMSYDKIFFVYGSFESARLLQVDDIQEA